MNGIGIATVYRNLRLLVDSGEVREIHLPKDAPRYRLARRCHAAVVRCMECGRAFDAPRVSIRPKSPSGFDVESFQLILNAHCKGLCDARATRNPPPVSRRI